MKYADYAKKFIDQYDRKYSGISFSIPNFSLYKDSYKTHVVDPTESFRPDKIAYHIYGDEDLSWIIDEINHISNAKEYIQGKEIYYLEEDILRNIGVF